MDDVILEAKRYRRTDTTAKLPFPASMQMFVWFYRQYFRKLDATCINAGLSVSRA